MTASTANPTQFPLTIQPLAVLSPPAASRAWQSSAHPSRPLLATACADRTIRIYSLTSFTLLTTLTGGHRRSVRCCAWKPSPLDSQAFASNTGRNGKSSVSRYPPVLATGSFDATAAVWVGPVPWGSGSAESQAEEGSFEGGDEDVEYNDVANDKCEDEEYRFAVVLEGHESEIKSLAWSAHGTFLATCSRDKSVWIWECLDNNPLADEGGFGVLGGGGGVTEDEDNYETVAVLQEHDGDVKHVAWHPEEERCLASASYDERVRIWREDSDGEWRCVGVCEGHEGTVWCVAWEPLDAQISTTADRIDPSAMDEDSTDDTNADLVSGPRLITCADDRTLRVWRRKPKPPIKQQSGTRMPNIIRSASDEEEWFEEARLPQVHERAVYTVAWSKTTKRIVSAGSDGKIIVYEERSGGTRGAGETTTEVLGHQNGSAADTNTVQPEWVVVAELENAHGVFEVNHVCWSRRWDSAKSGTNEEIIVSTGDDGEVRTWSVNGA